MMYHNYYSEVEDALVGRGGVVAEYMSHNHIEDESDISRYDFADMVSIVLYDIRVDSVEEAQQNLVGNWGLVCDAVKEFGDVNAFQNPMELDEVTKESCCWDLFDAITSGYYKH